MCGRYTQTQTGEAIAQAFDLPETPQLELRYNIAPSQSVAVIGRPNANSPRQLKYLRWGLIPIWAKDPSIGSRLINARAETAAEKPSFRAAFRRRRCLLVADGFYEWHRQLSGNKQPYYCRLRQGEPFGFAGLWEQWQSPQGEILRTCTILTTRANATLKPLHDRMPVILRPQDYDVWLNPEEVENDALQSLLQPYDDQALIAYPVSTRVNRASYDSVDCLEPLET